jgi:hypothetical protein
MPEPRTSSNGNRKPASAAMNTTAGAGVQSAVKAAAYALLLGYGAFLATLAPPTERNPAHLREPTQAGADLHHIRHVARRLATAANDLQATAGQDHALPVRSVGNLWIEVDRLKRQGQNVRQIEWHVSELEENLRGGQSDAAKRRHILNNLDYEIEVLNRRLRR